MTVSGLPAHPLLVHAVVVGLPLVALATVLAVVWPAARRRLGAVLPLAALAVVVLVPITVSAGRALIAQVGGPNPAIAAHARLGGTLLPWAVALFVLAAGVWFLGGVRDRRATPAAGLTEAPAVPAALRVALVVVGVLAILVAVLATWQVVEIGDSGARAVWGGA